MRRIAALALILTTLFSLNTVSVFAAKDDLYTVLPLIVDEKVKQRDIIKNSITITNNTERKIGIYASVHNVDPDSGEYIWEDHTKADRATSLAHWIEVTRGVIELMPGEVRQIPYLIQINYNAVPGTYHAAISFADGSNRPEAENKLPNVPKVILNIDVQDDAKERLQLGVFKSDKTFFSDSIASFSYLLENIGNRQVSPKGEIRIFNRKGEEVAILDANEESASLLPDAVSKLDAAWDSNGEFGRYKALLELEYGTNNTAAVYDTVFFWIIPWKKVMAIFLTLCVVLVMLSYIMYNRFNTKRQRAYAALYVAPDESMRERSEEPALEREPAQAAPQRRPAPQQVVRRVPEEKPVVERPVQTERTQVAVSARPRPTVGGDVRIANRTARGVGAGTIQLGERRKHSGDDSNTVTLR